MTSALSRLAIATADARASFEINERRAAADDDDAAGAQGAARNLRLYATLADDDERSAERACLVSTRANGRIELEVRALHEVRPDSRTFSPATHAHVLTRRERRARPTATARDRRTRLRRTFWSSWRRK
jgi:hypothetical protein